MTGQYPTIRQRIARRSRWTPRRGVTLLEIMVVVAILSILVGALAYLGGRSTDDARIKQTQAMLTSMNNVIAEYKGVVGTEPVTCVWLDLQSGGVRPPDVVDGGGERDDYYRDEDGNPAGQGEGYCSADNQGMCDSSALVVYSAQGLYHQLMRETAAKNALANIDARYIIPVASAEFQKHCAQYLPNAAPMTVHSTSLLQPGTVVQSAVFVDAWNQPLFYGWHPNTNNRLSFLQSAGPDGQWNTDDDLYSFE